MKTKRRLGVWIGVGTVVLVILTYCVLRFGFAIDLLDRSGWHEEDGAVQYWDYYGRPQLGWQSVDGKQFYFDPDSGALVTGWRQIGNDRHYFEEDGVPAVGWFHHDGKIYYLEKSGKAVTGWYRSENQLYYFSQDGSALTGWQMVDGQQYCFSEKGHALHGWQNRDGQRYYLSEEGTPVTGWQDIDGKTYYFAEDGRTVSGWVEVDGIPCLFAEDGFRYTGWYTDEAGSRFFDEGGEQCVGWLTWEEEQYFFGEDGLMYTGWLETEQDRYYLQADGTMAVGEVVIDGVSNFFTSKGKWTLMVNPWHAMPEGYTTDFVDLYGFKVDRQCRDAMKAMIEDCREVGYACYINNTYRSVAEQQYMWNVRIEQRMAEGMTYNQAISYIGQSLAIPKHSEHHTGLAVDIMGTDSMYDWLGEHCWEYGFIVRYPSNKMSVTGIIYEPWHFRYVGTELALELKELGICMEEYFAMLTQ